MRQLDLLTGRARKAPAPLEFSFACVIADMLRQSLKREWRFTHIPLGEYRTPATAGRLKRAGVVPGWPDYILLAPTGMAHFVELKRERGGRMSEEQRLFAEWCAENRVPHAVVRSLAEAVKVLGEWGAIRTAIHVQ